MKDYSIDFDLVKHIFWCKGVTNVQWRISASGKGFHFWWKCSKRTCKRCSEMEKQYDDVGRYRKDQKRAKEHRRVLWDIKGGRKALPWHRIERIEQ